MVNVYAPIQRTSVSYNVDTGEIQDTGNPPSSIEQLADQTGIVGAINQVNQESQSYDQQLRDDYGIDSDPQLEGQSFSEEDETPEKRTSVKPKKKKKDKRIDDLVGKYTHALNEKEELERELHRMRDENARYAASLLSAEQKRIADDIDRVSDVMMQAQQQDQASTYKKAVKLMHSLTAQEMETEKAFQNLQDSYAEQNKPNEVDEEVENTFVQLADKRELNSPHYYEWLQEKNFYDVRDRDNFDADLAQDVYQLKRDFNKYLKRTGNSDYIGSEDYYIEFDDIMNQQFGSMQAPAPQMQEEPIYGYEQSNYEDPYGMKHTIQVNPEYEKSFQGPRYAEGQPRQHTGDPSMMRPQQSYPQGPAQYQANYPAPGPQQRGYSQSAPVAPVNRGNQGGQNMRQSLPELSALEHKLAIQMPMKDQQGRLLSESERIHQYRVGKAEQMTGR